MRVRKPEGAGTMTSSGRSAVRTVAPPGGAVTEAEAALARLLRIEPGATATAEAPLVANAMLVAWVGTLIALVVLALSGLLL